MFAHLSALLGGLVTAGWAGGVGCFLGPLVIWLMKRETMPFVGDQAKEALNFNITVAAIMLVLFLVELFDATGTLMGVALAYGWSTDFYWLFLMLGGFAIYTQWTGEETLFIELWALPKFTTLLLLANRLNWKELFQTTLAFLPLFALHFIGYHLEHLWTAAAALPGSTMPTPAQADAIDVSLVHL